MQLIELSQYSVGVIVKKPELDVWVRSSAGGAGASTIADAHEVRFQFSRSTPMQLLAAAVLRLADEQNPAGAETKMSDEAPEGPELARLAQAVLVFVAILPIEAWSPVDGAARPTWTCDMEGEIEIGAGPVSLAGMVPAGMA